MLVRRVCEGFGGEVVCGVDGVCDVRRSGGLGGLCEGRGKGRGGGSGARVIM